MDKKWSIGMKVLGIFNMVWALILLFLFLGSQFAFVCGFLLAIFYIISGSGILSRNEKIRQIFLKVSIPLSLLAISNLIPFTSEKFPDYFRMDIADIIQFAGIFILLPLVINFYILIRPKVKEQFK